MYERAGSSPVVHLQGIMMDVKCFACHRPGKLTPDQLEIPEE
ncbi:hypothetical protein [Pseudomonas shirazensis]